MGWDVATIGIGHKLPIDNPKALAREVAQGLKKNIKLGYWAWLEYDEEKQYLSTKLYVFVEMDRFIVDKSLPFLCLSIPYYQERSIRAQLRRKPFSEISYSEDYLRFALMAEDNTHALYELGPEDIKESTISIFRENIDLDVYQTARWFGWTHYFNSIEHRETLHNYRIAVSEQAKSLGCSQVVYFSDQGPTQSIYEQVFLTAQELVEYIDKRAYVLDDKSLSQEEQDSWIKDGKIIQYADYFDGSLRLGDEEFIDIVYDDFRGLKEV